MKQRTFLRAALVAATVGLATASVARGGHRQVRLTRHQISWAGPGPVRIVHLTDLHLGRATPPQVLQQALRLTLAQRPDLVVLTGDYLNHTKTYLPELRRLAARLPGPCVATLGNHDHYSGAEAIQGALEDAGATVLRNEHTTLQLPGGPLTIVGVDDGHTDHADVARAVDGVAHPEHALGLTHSPVTADAMAATGVPLILVGHTHGGQLDVPLFTAALRRFAGLTRLAGWHELPGRPGGPVARLYVNAGLGSGALRYRVGPRAVPEVAVIELNPARRTP